MVLRPIRTLISLAFVAGAVWFSFKVPLGDKTLAQHLDAIGETPQAQELVDGARQTVNPALEQAKQRVLGERVEAPTYIPQHDERPAGAERRPSDDSTAGVPGQRG